MTERYIVRKSVLDMGVFVVIVEPEGESFDE